MPTLLALDRLLTRPAPEGFGRYELLGRLGSGGMAEVFVARCGELAEMRSLLALKRILPHLAEDEAFVSLFRREAQISLRLRHRAIARVFEVGRVGAAWFLAMELVPGESLAHLRRAEAALDLSPDPRLVAWVGAEISLALHHAHSLTDGAAPLEVIHRDVSPQNLLLGFDGAAKLIDFGVARCTRLSNATRTGTVRGKLAYASPEQLGGAVLDGRSDLFSLAVVLHEWLAGTSLFSRDSDAATLQAVQHAPIPPLPRAPRLGAVLERALERDPRRRFADGESFAQALLAAVDGAPPAPERLVAAHLARVFPDRKQRWEKVLSHGAEGSSLFESSELHPARVPGPLPPGKSPTGTLAATKTLPPGVNVNGHLDLRPIRRPRAGRMRQLALTGAATVAVAGLFLGWAHRHRASPDRAVSAEPKLVEMASRRPATHVTTAPSPWLPAPGPVDDGPTPGPEARRAEERSAPVADNDAPPALEARRAEEGRARVGEARRRRRPHRSRHAAATAAGSSARTAVSTRAVAEELEATVPVEAGPTPRSAPAARTGDRRALVDELEPSPYAPVPR